MTAMRMSGEAGDSGGPMLDRATAALRDTAIPDGPSPLARERTLAALAAGGPAGRAGWAGVLSRAATGTLARVAAVVVLAAGAAATYFVLAGVVGRNGRTAVVTTQSAPLRTP